MSTLRPVEGALDPSMITRVASLPRSIDFLPPMSSQESGQLRGIFVMRYPVVLLFRGVTLAGLFICPSANPPANQADAMRMASNAIPVTGKVGTWDVAIVSALTAVDDELRAAGIIQGVDDRQKQATAREAVDRWLFANRSTEVSPDAQGTSYATPRTGQRKAL